MKKRGKLETRLHTLGKRCFVNCFELACQKGGRLTGSEVQECDPEVGADALAERAGLIKRIFADGHQWDALRECRIVQRDEETEKKAAALCKKYNVR